MRYSHRLFISLLLLTLLPAVAGAQVTVIKAGQLVDPDAGTILKNQVILIENGKFAAVGSGVTIPPGAEVVDLSNLTVLPGLVDAHNHLALTYKEEPESNVYYLTYVKVSFVLKDGVVFKRDGVMTPARFFHGGPVKGWRIR